MTAAGMTLVFTSYAQTPQEMKSEFVDWCREHATALEERSTRMPLKRDKSRALNEASAYREAAQFWGNVKITTAPCASRKATT